MADAGRGEHLSSISALKRHYRPLIGLFTGIIQLPAVLWLCAHVRSPWPAAVAAVLSLPYILQLRTPWHTPKSRHGAYVALSWWASCLMFDLLMGPVALLVRAHVAPAGVLWTAAGTLALTLGLRAVVGRPRVRRTVVRVAGLSPALDGYRIGQLSDVHCGPDVSEARVARWVRRLNRQRVDLMTVTGDLITQGSVYVEAVCRALGGLRARDGVFACMGNHDYFTDGDALVRLLESRGLKVLRNEGHLVHRGEAQLYVAGVDDTWSSRDDLDQALRGRPAGATTVLLAHDPDLFPQARAREVELTLSGHTHGGQLAVPGVRRWSLARLFTVWTSGLYRMGSSSLYVNKGAGTTGPRVRLGAASELAVITLRRA